MAGYFYDREDIVSRAIDPMKCQLHNMEKQFQQMQENQEAINHMHRLMIDQQEMAAHPPMVFGGPGYLDSSSRFSPGQIIPMGVSEWKEHGIKHGYWDYFKESVIKDHAEHFYDSKNITTTKHPDDKVKIQESNIIIGDKVSVKKHEPMEL